MKLKLIDKKQVVKGVTSFYFEPDATFEWTAGQYLIYSLKHEKEDLRGRQRFFTISSSPFQKTPVITTRIEEKPSSFKNALNHLEIGDTLEAKGPDGDFVIGSPQAKYIFIAGGIGITPFMSIIRELDFEKKPINVTLLYANKTEDIVFRKELDQIMGNHPELKIHYVISPKHIDENFLKENIHDLEKYIFYISGPDPMVEAMENTLRKLGIKGDNIKEDYFSGYKSI